MLQYHQMEALLEFITHLGWMAVVGVIFAECGLMMGFFLPGDSLLFTAGFLVQEGFFKINIHAFVALLFFAAVLGNSSAYYFGKRVGRRLFDRKNSRFFHKENLLRAERFYEKHGSKAVILAMFVPIARTFTPIVAGVSHMEYRRFLTYVLVGALIWTAGFTYLGYYAGQVIRDMGINIEVAALIIIALSLTPAVFHVLSEPEGRAAVKRHATRVLKRSR